MKCNHVDKDAPENAICEDCGNTRAAHRQLENLKLMKICATPNYPEYIKAMKGGLKNGRSNR